MNGGGQFCLEQNINLCNLMCCFYAKQSFKQSSKFAAQLKYLIEIINQLKGNCNDNYLYLEPALRKHLQFNGLQLLQKHATDTRLLLHSTIEAFLANQIPHKDGVSAKILVLLCNIVQTPELFQAYGAEEFTEFLQYLPQLLLKPTISEAALKSMSNLGKQQHNIFLKALAELTPQIIQNIQKIQVAGATNAFEGKRHIMNLFYWTAERQQMSKELRNELLAKVNEHISDKRIVSYYQFILGETSI